MSQATKFILDPGETIEQRIELILAIMSQDLTADDRAVLQTMLVQALVKKKVSQAQSLSDLRSKYAAKKKSDQEDVINVDESPEAKQSKPKKDKPNEKPTDKNTTQTKPTKAPTKKVTPKKSSVVVTREDAKKVKGPPTKRKAAPSPDVSMYRVRSMTQGTPTLILTTVLLSVLQKEGALKANQRDRLERDVLAALDHH